MFDPLTPVVRGISEVLLRGVIAAERLADAQERSNMILRELYNRNLALHDTRWIPESETDRMARGR